MASEPLARMLNELVLFYGVRLPYHPGKWKVVETLTERLGLDRFYRGKTFTARRQGVTWALNLDCLIQRAVYYLSVFELKETEWLKAQVKEDWVFFDVGANFGYYSMLASAASRGRARVYAFEPLASNCALIERNKSLNGFDGLRVFKIALSDREGEVGFFVPPDSCSGVGHIVEGDADSAGGHIDTVQATTLDSFVAQHGVERLDFLKIDVEGAETSVLRGGRETLRRFRPRIMIEFFPEGLAKLNTSADELLALIHELGYDTFSITASGLEPFSDTAIDDHCNVACIPKP